MFSVAYWENNLIFAMFFLKILTDFIFSLILLEPMGRSGGGGKQEEEKGKKERSK